MTTPSEQAQEPLNLRAYYYSFEPTGVYEIDLILSAVARAGKSYHHTESWGDQSLAVYPPFEGDNWIDRIQNAANGAAAILASRKVEADRCQRCGEVHATTNGVPDPSPYGGWHNFMSQVEADARLAELEAAAQFFMEQGGERHSESHWMNEWPESTPDKCEWCRHALATQSAPIAAPAEEGGRA